MTVVFSILVYLLTVGAYHNAPPHPAGIEAGVATPIERAKELLNNGRFSESIQILSLYRPSAEELSSYHYILATAFKRLNRWQDYMDHLRLSYIYSRKEDQPGLLIERAEAFMERGYYSEASLVFKIFLKNSHPDEEMKRAYIGLGESLYRLGLFEEAINRFRAGGDDPRALYGTAMALQAAGRTEEAAEAFTRAMLRDKDYLKRSEEAIYRLGENLIMLKKVEEARQYLRLIKDRRLRPKADLLIATASIQDKRYDEALRYLNNSLLNGDRDTKRKALMLMAEAYEARGMKKEAEERLLQIRYHYPYGKVYDKALIKLARLYREEKRSEEAIPILKELVFRRSPDRDALQEFEAIIMDASEKDQGRLLALWNSIGHWLLDPSRSERLIMVARALRGSGSPFIKLTSWLSKNGPSNIQSETGILLADFYADMGEPDRAEEFMKKIRKGGDDFYRVRAKVSLLRSNTGGAINAIISIREIKRDDLKLISEVMSCIENTNKGEPKGLNKLLAHYKKALVKGDMHDHIRFADMLYKSGNKEEAISYYEKALAMADVTGASQNEKKVEDLFDDREWAYYRIGKGLEKIRDGRLKRLGEVIAREREINERLKEVL